jgi:hypothetical protein
MDIQANLGGLWTCDLGEIRMTPQGQPSVFDMIRVLGGQKNPRDAWQRLVESHPEVVGKCDNLRFPGRGQRETPIARTKEDAYYILGLLPGAVGRKYREQAAELFSRFLDDPASVASAAVERMSDEERDRLEARLKGKRTRHVFTDVLKDHGVVQVGYGNCTNAVYVQILGATARQLKVGIAATKNLPVQRVNPRDHFSVQQLGDVETAERIAAGQIRRQSAHGNTAVEHVVLHSAAYTRRLLDGDIDIPGLSH